MNNSAMRRILLILLLAAPAFSQTAPLFVNEATIELRSRRKPFKNTLPFLQESDRFDA
jgi:hypothetical protein